MKNERIENVCRRAKTKTGEVSFRHGQYNVRVVPYSLPDAHYNLCRDIAYRKVFDGMRDKLMPMLKERDTFYIPRNILSKEVLTRLKAERDSLIAYGKIKVRANVEVKYGADCKIVVVPCVGDEDLIGIAKEALNTKEVLVVEYSGQ